MLLILIAMFVGHWLSRMFSQRVIQLVAHNGARGSSIEREARARTLIGVLHNAVSLAIFVGGGLMILQEAGIPIAPLLGGAAVFGLAVAFGAQNLIRDYFYGFVILLENQYKLNDVVQIGAISGQVEMITLRMTVLRDLEGRVHFVPNGQISAVTNMTHGWSRALFDIGVAYKENVDRVMAVIMALAHELRTDPYFGPMILEDATMLGVDDLGDSAVTIKFYIKTLPLQQWNIKRELLRRIKNRFDEIGIEIPYPHRTLFHRFDPDAAPLPADSMVGTTRIIHGVHPHRPTQRPEG
jgi:small conductance mechanosensitive channel